MRIVHIINCLSIGGAERQLLRLAEAQRQGGDETMIVTLLDKDTLRADADRAGIQVVPLGLRGMTALPRTLRALRRTVDSFEPDVVQSWLYWANLASMLALGRSRQRRRMPLAWNIRQTLPDLTHERWAMRQALRLGARWSTNTDALVYNAETARDQHRAAGYGAAIEAVIPNAIDVESAPFGPTARRTARVALNLPPEVPTIAHAARLHPMKDHAGFLQAVAPLLARDAQVVVVLFGRDVTPDRFANALARHAQLAEAVRTRRLLFLGERRDLPALLPAFDCVVSSSAWGEAFPNVVAEAMAAAVPVIATDVGDARSIVGETGQIVAPRSPSVLTEAMEALLAMDPAARHALGMAARSRIAERTSTASVLLAYQRLWTSLRERSPMT